MRLFKFNKSDSSGFTLIELSVSLAVAAIAILATLFIASGMTRQLRNTGQSMGAQGNARIATDEITRMLRSAGSGTDYSNGQGRFLAAGPYTVAFNANLQPADDPSGAGEPAAVDPTLPNPTVPLTGSDVYTPPMDYSTGAETVLLTLDSNRDGSIGSADATDDNEEASTNPNDYVLKSVVYGKAGGENRVTSTGIAVLRGPSTDGSTPADPVFQYWIDTDNDPSTAATLYGDTDHDGALSSTEEAALGVVPTNQLGLIERIAVTAVTEPEKPRDGGSYPQTVLRSSVSFRNRSNTAAHVVGIVFNDVDRNGLQGSSELGIRDVIIRSSNGTKTKTDVDGHYSFVFTPAIYTITEVDPNHYESTTSNVVQVSPGPGDYTVVNFGDYSTLGVGTILGTVFSDVNGDGTRDVNERGITGVRLYLDTGQSVTTNSSGRYSFMVQTQDYVLTEEDSIGYTSITPNVVDVNLQSNGDSVVVDFADQKISNGGTIHGIVFRDDNNDGVKANAEPGVANTTVNLDGSQNTNTDSRGEFTFNASPGAHRVTETDPPGYTSSTLNVVDVTVVTHQTVEVRFGDIAQQDISFQEIALGNTNRALSIGSLDTGEDNKSDMDIILGTHYVGGQNDILVWWNNRTNSSTPNSALFTSTASYARTIAADVNAVAVPDLNGDGRQDCISALGTTTNNLNAWLTQGGGSKGQLPTSPSGQYTASGATNVNDVVTGTFDTNTNLDLVIGTKTGLYSGKIEIWHGNGSGGFSRNNGNDVLTTVPGLVTNWGEIVSLSAADFTGDGHTDVVVAARTSTSSSTVYVLAYGPGQAANSDFYLLSSFVVLGAINDVAAVNMFEEDTSDVDILVAVENTPTSGRVDLWSNRGDNHFGFGDIPDVTPDDTIDAGGSPLSISTAKIDNDVYPDMVVGTRIGPYSGKVAVYRCFGYLPSSGTVISTTDVGEVITMTTADYNKDGAPDFSVGTRSSATSGKVVIYFNTRPAL